MSFLDIQGTCPVCGPDAHFVAADSWLRDSFGCTRCHSLPRERAMISAIDMYVPNWRDLLIHESSPVWRGASVKLHDEAKGYSFSYFDPQRPLGGPHFVNGAVNQDIERMTFEDESFDMFVTQDVFEHIFRPDLAIREIERVLKPGGYYIMTVPLVNRERHSERRAELQNDSINYIKPAAFHGDPVNANGTLVTIDWGFDACGYLSHHSGMRCAVLVIEDLSRGIRAAYNEIVVMQKGSWRAI
ncbi:class I SAM-dependent methyltransferase [Acidisoma sp. S159]|uniref:class I SAM-dependent methyltransferase n=1 Tax=Acidisoma sp. S159 TaxID=1747225 RepID=UPI00131E2F34|nr:class I SAM-dependent methyltransferase [Acidisoma sp. S159]